ncbi:HNH endonuclease [Shewanella baltica]|uniref:HNH endonuclease n=1 Tax=Shewanella baltica TaxID=62322 RepID=UPI0032186834
MRPVLRRGAPLNTDFKDYRDAFVPLLKRIGIGEFNNLQIAQYCSYCERVIPTNLAIEHIKHKDANPALMNRWSNFLLGCVNCNSTKGQKIVDFKGLYLPDRDNTFKALTYTPQGRVTPNQQLSAHQKQLAQNTIDLVGLDVPIQRSIDGVAIDRRSQRLNAYLLALDTLEDYENDILNPAHQKLVVKSMLTTGFFSIWMAVFSDHPHIMSLFISAMKGTSESGCFDANAQTISPHPNQDQLDDGGKI